MAGSNEISKKEYLKRYLSGGDKKKKKKKISNKSNAASKIVDDDLGLNHLQDIDDAELELYGLAEDAPQIAGIVDERPEEVRVMAEYRETKKWKIMADDKENGELRVSSLEHSKQKEDSDSDHSPPRKSHNSSKEKKHAQKSNDSDESPPRRNSKKEAGRNNDSDVSPPRCNSKKEVGRNNDSDESPPRKKRRDRSGSDSDKSPPRKKKPDDRGHHKHKHTNNSPQRRKKDKSDSDHSPPRNKSAPRSNTSNHRRHRNSDTSPTRQKKKYSDSSSDSEKPAKHRTDKEKRQHSVDKKDTSKHPVKRDKTLDGKKAGLQNAEELKKEITDFKRRQEEAFSKMSDDVSGRNATAVLRDKKTGKKRDLAEERRRAREENEKRAEKEAKYAVWGKGVKQTEDREEKLKQDLYEMSKPLARYADDKDLDEMLKQQDREGDPMLEYVQKKKESGKGAAANHPIYKGSYPPNRYNIRPGYRWDGVDRSSGYEKKWFQEQNSRKAREEEAFKWSTSDM